MKESFNNENIEPKKQDNSTKETSNLAKNTRRLLVATGVALSALVPNKSEAQKAQKSKHNMVAIEHQQENLYEKAFENIILSKTENEKRQIALTMTKELLKNQQEKIMPLLKRINYYGKNDYSESNKKIQKDYPDVKIAPGVIKEKADSGRAHYTHNTVHFPTMLKNKIPTSKDTFETLTAEIPHYIQEKKYGRLKSDIKAYREFFKYGDDKRYEVPGTHEYEAHAIIEPELIKKYSPDTTTTEYERKEILLLEKIDRALFELNQGWLNEEKLDQYICDLSLNPYFKNRSTSFVLDRVEIPPFKK